MDARMCLTKICFFRQLNWTDDPKKFAFVSNQPRDEDIERIRVAHNSLTNHHAWDARSSLLMGSVL